MEAHHPPVAAEVSPRPDGLRARRLGEGPRRGEKGDERFVEGDRARYLDLLEHDFGDEHAPGIAGAPPRQVAPVLLEPGDQGPAHRLGLGGVKLETVRACRFLAHVREGTRAAPLDKSGSGRTWLGEPLGWDNSRSAEGDLADEVRSLKADGD